MARPLQDGLQINLRKLNSVTVNDDDTVTVGGGTLQQELVSQLYEHGKKAGNILTSEFQR